MRVLLQHLQEYMCIHLAKSIFRTSAIDFFQYHVFTDNLIPFPHKLKAIQMYPLSVSVCRLREFLDMVNFYHRFIPNVGETLVLLHKLTRGAKKNSQKTLHGTPAAIRSFEHVNRQLTHLPFLSNSSPATSLELLTDASHMALGAMLQQSDNRVHQPLQFFSCRLSDTEKRYNTYN